MKNFLVISLFFLLLSPTVLSAQDSTVTCGHATAEVVTLTYVDNSDLFPVCLVYDHELTCEGLVLTVMNDCKADIQFETPWYEEVPRPSFFLPPLSQRIPEGQSQEIEIRVFWEDFEEGEFLEQYCEWQLDGKDTCLTVSGVLDLVDQAPDMGDQVDMGTDEADMEDGSNSSDDDDEDRGGCSITRKAEPSPILFVLLGIFVIGLRRRTNRKSNSREARSKLCRRRKENSRKARKKTSSLRELR